MPKLLRLDFTHSAHEVVGLCFQRWLSPVQDNPPHAAGPSCVPNNTEAKREMNILFTGLEMCVVDDFDEASRVDETVAVRTILASTFSFCVRETHCAPHTLIFNLGM